MFQLGVVSIINKPTRVTSSSVTAIDNILTNSFFDLSLKTGIIKTDISDHFPIYFSIKTVFLNEKSPSIHQSDNSAAIINFDAVKVLVTN